MHIQAIYTYPIKSLRGFELESSKLTKHGLPHDRRYILVKDNGVDAELRYVPMFVSKFPEMCLFSTKFVATDDDDEAGEIEVTYNSPSSASSSITIPLTPPNPNTLSTIDVDLHNSPVRALAMPDNYSSWFSTCFGYRVILAHLGSRYRQALGNLAPSAAKRNPILRQQAEEREQRIASQQAEAASASSSWTSRLTALVTGASSQTNNEDAENYDRFDQPIHEEDYGITFADVAPYLLTTTASLDDVTTRISSSDSATAAEKADMTKFRPNIVLTSDSADELSPYEEDFWGEICITSSSKNQQQQQGEQQSVKLLLNHNCTRCVSLNVDYASGKTDGPNVLKLLQKDRRVDGAVKYSPVFGRYAWLLRGEGGEGFEIRVGDEVKVTKRNESRTAQRWPGLGGNPKEVVWPDVE